MKPIPFKEQNIVFAENQDEYESLPAHKVDEPEGRVIFCQKLSWKERFKVLFTGNIWCCLMTFNQALQPSFFTTEKTDLFPEE